MSAVLEQPRGRAADDHDDAADEPLSHEEPSEHTGGGDFDGDGPDEGGGGGGNDDDGDNDDDDVRWVTVATFWKPTDAQLARIKLESEGIDVVILDENLIATDWLMANAIGGIKLQVPEPDAAAAGALLAGSRAAARPVSDEPVADGQERCPRCASEEIYPTNVSRRMSFLAL